MATQPVPNVTRADVERIVSRDFPAADVAAALAVLDQYGVEAWEGARERVQLAALKLAGGSLDELRRHIAVAKRDFRDVVAAAEYPACMERNWTEFDRLGDAESQRVYDADWAQYREWFERP